MVSADLVRVRDAEGLSATDTGVVASCMNGKSSTTGKGEALEVADPKAAGVPLLISPSRFVQKQRDLRCKKSLCFSE